eukprot:CAMPEP_0185378010 /NCGR_PEP_ID=MMETSP1364-20130426/43807_1 /TAXON_ID=38817 /ORGANISM="Gephyrocapsa oceanica, Strain RCC1303" /LENGTH=109 /DNA_ID=CAMNT_0027979507 /DNA_START=71 /DNA_END=400 /DNA_ORIENTATION=-
MEVFVMGRAPGRAGVSKVSVLLDLHLADADEVRRQAARQLAVKPETLAISYKDTTLEAGKPLIQYGVEAGSTLDFGPRPHTHVAAVPAPPSGGPGPASSSPSPYSLPRQ